MNRRGAVLVLCYLFVSILVILLGSTWVRHFHDGQLSARYLHRLSAMHVAEAGMDQAIVRLQYSAYYAGSGMQPLGPESTYDMSVGASTGILNSRIVPRRIRPLESIGTYPTSAAGGGEQRRLAALITQEPIIFSHAIFSEGTFEFTGNLITDSYDSRFGPYGPGNELGEFGRIGTSAINAGSINITGGNLDVHNAILQCGVDCPTPELAIQVFPSVATVGGKEALPEEKWLPMFNVLPATLINEGALNVPAGQTLSIAPGPHLYTKITIGANATLTSAGSLQLFVMPPTISGPLDSPLSLMPGAQIYASSTSPDDVRIFIAIPQFFGSLDLNLAGTMYAALYVVSEGPGTLNLNLLNSNATIYGSLIFNVPQLYASTAALMGLVVHYDRALLSNGHPTRPVDAAWMYFAEPLTWKMDAN